MTKSTRQKHAKDLLVLTPSIELKAGLKRVGRKFELLKFGQKLLFWSRTEIFVKNRKIGRQKIQMLVKNRNFGQKSKFWSQIELFVKNRTFGQKSKFWSKIEILVKNRNFGQKSNVS